MKLVYRLKHAQEKLAQLKNHLTFLIRCRENHITPTSIRVTLPLRAPGVHRIIGCTELALLCLLIHKVCYKKVKTEKESGVLGEEIKTLVNAEQWNRLEAWCSSTMEMIGLDTKAKQIQKFDHLQTKQHLAPQLD